MDSINPLITEQINKRIGVRNGLWYQLALTRDVTGVITLHLNAFSTPSGNDLIKSWELNNASDFDWKVNTWGVVRNGDGRRLHNNGAGYTAENEDDLFAKLPKYILDEINSGTLLLSE